jgi:hypothetical protein
MNEQVKKDILIVLKSSIDCLSKNLCSLLQSTSDKVIHNASIFQDEYSTSVAIIIYALAKMSERTNDINPQIISELKSAYDKLNSGNENAFLQDLKDLMNLIENEDRKAKYYFKHVIDKAKIKKGTKIYDHGISSKRVADMLGRSQWELMSYIGRTNISDHYDHTINMKKKISLC